MKCALLALLWMAVPLFAESLPSVKISRNGEALLPILVPKDAEMETLAQELANGLKRITGATFTCEECHPGSRGIILGTEKELPGILAERQGAPPSHTREDYAIRSDAQGCLYIVGRTPLAVQNAIWGLFYELGFRQFFPSPQWEIWPTNESLEIAMDRQESPSFALRLLTAGVATATWPENHAAMKEWQKRNRMVSGFRLNTGHAYQDIVRRNQSWFEQHPEGLIENGKLDPSLPEVVAVVQADALNEFRKNAGMDSVSMDPSDGGGWRKDSPLGSPSNQAVFLANAAAEALRGEFPGSKVGMYAYHEHSTPPDIPVDQDVIVSVATSFIQNGQSVDSLLSGWKEKGATLGIRDYLSVFSWHHDMPGKSVTSGVRGWASDLRRYYAKGARYWRSEGSHAWGPHGVGYYVASRLLWDIDADVEALLEDFYAKSFGDAAATMKVFFEKYIYEEGRPLLSSDLIGRMYRTLESALRETSDAAAQRRIEDYILYTHYVELFMTYQQAEGAARVNAWRQLARFSYRIKDRDMVNSRAVFRSLPARDTALKKQPRWNDPGHPLKEETEFDMEAVEAILQEGIRNHPLVDFEPVAFSRNLVPAEIQQSHRANEHPVRVRGTSSIYLYATAPETEFAFTVRGGLIYNNKGPVRLRLFAERHVIPDEAVAESEVPPDGKERAVTLKSGYEGLHRLEIQDGRGQTDINWPAGQIAAIPMAWEENTPLSGTLQLMFFVPRGTKAVAGYSERSKGGLRTPDGKVAFRFESMSKAGYFSVDVPDNTDGKWWSISSSGDKRLLTVPPFLSRTPDEGLLPREVLE